MDALFENTTTRTEALDKEFFRYARNWKNLAVPIVMVIGLLGFCVYCLRKIRTEGLVMLWAALIIFALAGLGVAVTALRECRQYKVTRKQLQKIYGTADLVNRVRFYETHYELSCEQTGVETRVGYSEIARIRITPTLLLLVRTNQAVTVLARDGFTDKNALAFLTDACAAAKVRDFRKGRE